jgi:hypothetical protein
MTLRFAPIAALLLCSAAPLAAQVGNPPEHSPYHDITKGRSVTGLYGHIGGDGGTLGIGPHHGASYGLRFDVRLGGVMQIGLGAGYAALERLIVDADAPKATRVKGPVSQNINMFETTLQFNVTGKKTWHGIAPFVAGSIGLAWGNEPAADTSGYHFGTRIYFGAGIGTRFFIGQRIFLRGELRQLFWQLKYPNSYFEIPANATTEPPVLLNQKPDQWTGGREIRAGLGFAF